MATKASTLARTYDPFRAIEGMFNGSVTRIAYVFKDPANFGPSTKAVLGETSKSFQDALDDCEIQLLDAKCYLEHQLALNKARREAKAQEDSASIAKRKLNEMKDITMAYGEPEPEEQPAKRQKVEDTPGTPMNVQEPQTAQPEPPAHADEQAEPINASEPEEPVAARAEEASATAAVVDDVKSEPTRPQMTISTEQTRPPTSDAPLKSTSHETPTYDFDRNFESMFGEPSGGPDSGMDTFNFDMDLTPNQFGTNTNLDDSSSLNTFLPGLESYANQLGDDASGLNFGNNGNTASNPEAGANAGLGNDFDLPDISNDWDALLNDTSVGGMPDGGDEMVNDNSTINMEDFDSFFN